MSLNTKFVVYFKDFEEINTSDIFKWYKEVRSGSSKHTYHSNIYNIVIYPMVARGTIVRVRRGVYRLQTTLALAEQNTLEQFSTDADIVVDSHQWEGNDEWDEYIKEKMSKEEE